MCIAEWIHGKEHAIVIKRFITSTFAFIYQFIIQRAFKFIVNTYFVEIGRPKYFLMAKATTNFF